MNRDVAELEERFQQLNRSRSALSAEMRAAAMALRATGAIPIVELERSLEDYREFFGRFRAELGITSLESDSASGTTWDQFHSRLGDCREAVEATLRLSVVDRLRVDRGFEATLDPVRQMWSEAVTRLSGSPWKELELIQEIQSGRHPVCRLLSLVEHLDELSDDEWTAEMAAIQQSFGVQVSTAIARGKVVLTEEGQAN